MVSDSPHRRIVKLLLRGSACYRLCRAGAKTGRVHCQGVSGRCLSAHSLRGILAQSNITWLFRPALILPSLIRHLDPLLVFGGLTVMNNRETATLRRVIASNSPHLALLEVMAMWGNTHTHTHTFNDPFQGLPR